MGPGGAVGTVRIGLYFAWSASLLQHLLQAGLLGIDHYAGFSYLIMVVLAGMMLAFEAFQTKQAFPICSNVVLQHLVGASSNIVVSGGPAAGLQSLERVLCLLALTLYLLLKGIRGATLQMVVMACAILTLITVGVGLGRSSGGLWTPTGLGDVNMLLSWGFTTFVTGAVLHHQLCAEREERRPAGRRRICPGLPTPDAIGGSVIRQSTTSNYSDRYGVAHEPSCDSLTPPGPTTEGMSSTSWPNFSSPTTSLPLGEPPRRPGGSKAVVLPEPTGSDDNESFNSVVAVVNTTTHSQPSGGAGGATRSGSKAADASNAELDGVYDDMATTEVLNRLNEEVDGSGPVARAEDDDILLT